MKLVVARGAVRLGPVDVCLGVTRTLIGGMHDRYRHSPEIQEKAERRDVPKKDPGLVHDSV